MKAFARVPAGARDLEMIEGRNVRLDVEQRSAIQNIDSLHKEVILLNAQETNRGDPNVIGAGRRAGGENPALLVVQVGAGNQLRRGGAIQQVNQPDALESLYVLEPLGKLRVDFHDTLGAAGGRHLNRRSLRAEKGGADHAQRGHSWYGGAKI